MNNTKADCPVCKLEQNVKQSNQSPKEGYFQYDCPRCGIYNIDGKTEAMVRIEANKENQMEISAYIRNHYEVKKEPYILTWETFTNIESLLPDYGVLEKQLILLQNIA